jgi:hypothetical protein
MCLDWKNHYQMAGLDYFKCMKMPLKLFSKWIKKQYDLDVHERNDSMYLETWQTVWGLPKAGV